MDRWIAVRGRMIARSDRRGLLVARLPHALAAELQDPRVIDPRSKWAEAGLSTDGEGRKQRVSRLRVSSPCMVLCPGILAVLIALIAPSSTINGTFDSIKEHPPH